MANLVRLLHERQRQGPGAPTFGEFPRCNIFQPNSKHQGCWKEFSQLFLTWTTKMWNGRGDNVAIMGFSQGKVSSATVNAGEHAWGVFQTSIIAVLGREDQRQPVRTRWQRVGTILKIDIAFDLWCRKSAGDEKAYAGKIADNFYLKNFAEGLLVL